MLTLPFSRFFFCLTQFSVNVYNPLARPVTWPVRLPVNGTAYSVSDASGKAVDCQVSMCASSKYEMIQNKLCSCQTVTQDIDGSHLRE